MIQTAEQLRKRLHAREIIRRKRMARAVENDDLDEVEPDENEELEATDEVDETPKRGRGRPKGSKNASTGPDKNFHGIILSKLGMPKHIIVTHVMGKNVMAVSAKNPNMDAVRLPVGSVYHYNEEIFEALADKGEKIAAAISQNQGLAKGQLKPVNAPKRVARVTDPIDEL